MRDIHWELFELIGKLGVRVVSRERSETDPGEGDITKIQLLTTFSLI